MEEKKPRVYASPHCEGFGATLRISQTGEGSYVLTGRNLLEKLVATTCLLTMYLDRPQGHEADFVCGVFCLWLASHCHKRSQ